MLHIITVIFQVFRAKHKKLNQLNMRRCFGEEKNVSRSKMFDHNFEFLSHNFDFISHNFAFLPHNFLLSYLIISTFYLIIMTYHRAIFFFLLAEADRVAVQFSLTKRFCLVLLIQSQLEIKQTTTTWVF